MQKLKLKANENYVWEQKSLTVHSCEIFGFPSFKLNSNMKFTEVLAKGMWFV